MPTFTEDEFKALLEKVAAEAAQKAVSGTQTSDPVLRQLHSQGIYPRISGLLNWQKDQQAWLSLSADERQAEIANQDLANRFADDVMPIRHAIEYVQSARRTGATIPPEILELSRQDPDQFNTVEIEGLTEQVIHTGDGRKLIKGHRLKIHPALAQLLENKGAARKIDDETDDDQDGANVHSIADVSRG